MAGYPIYLSYPCACTILYHVSPACIGVVLRVVWSLLYRPMKRSFETTTVPRLTAIELLGEQADVPYTRAVGLLRRMSISTPGRRVLSKAQAHSYYPVDQAARLGRVPPGVAELSESSDMVDYARRALLLVSPFDAVVPEMPEDLRDAIRFTCSHGWDIAAWRLQRLRDLVEIAQSLRPMSDRILARRPEHVAWTGGPDVNPAFMSAISEALESPDVSLPAAVYLTGFPIVGQATDTGLWRRRSAWEIRRAGPKISVAELLSSNLRFTATIISSLPKQWRSARASGDSDWLRLNQMAWQATIDEVNIKFSARGPFTRSRMDAKFGYGKWRPIRRFGIPKGTGVRPCDDATQSGHNSAFISGHVMATCPNDFPAAAAREFFDAYSTGASAAVGGSIGAAKEDVPNAYRTVPTATPGLTIVAIVHPSSGVVWFFETRGLNFGLAAAGENFVRLPELLIMASRRLLAVPSALFIDDVQVVESEASRGFPVAGADGLLCFPGSAHSSFVSMCGIAAFPLSIPKREEWSVSPVALGIESDLSRAHVDGSIRQRIAGPTRVKASMLVESFQRSQSLSPSQAASLRGKLGHLFSRSSVARAALAPLTRRQYQLPGAGDDHSGSLAWALTEDLRSSLSFSADMLAGLLPDLLYHGPSSRGRPLVMFSDASLLPPVPPMLVGSGRVGFVVFHPDGRSATWASADVPVDLMLRLHSFRNRKTHIISLEAIALFSPFFSPELQNLLAGADVFQFADNQTVNAISVKGYSSAPDVGRMLSAFSLRLASLGARTWVVYVPTELNIADPLSRPPVPGMPECHALLVFGLELIRIDFVFPSAFSWINF